MASRVERVVVESKSIGPPPWLLLNAASAVVRPTNQRPEHW